MKAIVKIVWDDKRNKLRAQPVGMLGFVRFPNHLRQEGAMYEVADLRPGKAGSWIATGEIRAVNVSQQSIGYRRAA